MPVLPIPMIISLLLLCLLAARLSSKEAHVSLLALIAVCAVQSAIIAATQYYGIAAFRPLQPIIAMAIPAIAWLAFSQAAFDNLQKRWWLHSVGVVLALLCFGFWPALLDAIIPMSFLGYGMAMLLKLARGEDSLPHSRLESAGLPLFTWRVIAVSLMASAACDVFIAYQLATGGKSTHLWVPSVVSSLTMLSLGVLAVTHAMESRRDEEPDQRVSSDEELIRDQAIVEKLDRYMLSAKPFLDPDLTLSRLSRKLLVPVKQLSSAINRVKNENVSRYVNRARIEEACEKLKGGSGVTAVIFESGFNTKSNFNREFLRVKGMSPRDWVRREKG
jgi:AraC-like DNA-binding protein